jgi:hypothetical protein
MPNLGTWHGGLPISKSFSTKLTHGTKGINRNIAMFPTSDMLATLSVRNL